MSEKLDKQKMLNLLRLQIDTARKIPEHPTESLAIANGTIIGFVEGLIKAIESGRLDAGKDE